MTADSSAVRVVIRGRVQGVGYRAWAVRQAEARNLAGWVRNRQDGGVEALFCGPRDTVEAMVEACRRGPAGAWVELIERADGADVPSAACANTFLVLPTC